MRNLLFILVLLIATSQVFGQQTAGDGLRAFNDSLARSRNQITRDAMLTLGGFAVVNIASGFSVASATQGETRYGWRMNGYWNFINLGVAGLGYWGLRNAVAKTYTLADNERAQLSIEKTYAVNFGLDVAYIAGGFYLRSRGDAQTKPDARDQFKGYGSSIIFQGAFLLLMDGVMIGLHHRNSNRLNEHLRRLEYLNIFKT